MGSLNPPISKGVGAAGLPAAADGTPIQAPSKFSCEDATAGTTLKFPMTLSSDTAVTLVPPANAVALVLRPVGEILRVSSEVAAVTSQNDKIPDGGSEVFPCAGHAAVYIKRDAAVSTVVNGHWRLIGA